MHMPSDFDLAINAVMLVTGVARADILSRSRVYPAVEARQIITLLLSADGYPFSAIGDFLLRDRSTISYAATAARNALDVSSCFKSNFDLSKSYYEQSKSLRSAKVRLPGRR